MDFITVLKDALVLHLDRTLAYMAVTILLYFYGAALVKRIVRGIKGSKLTRFVLFLVIAFFGLNLLVLLLVSLIISVTGNFKWLIILGLNIWAFVEFDKEILSDKKKV